ncbi:DUF5709 domain-containing protein [Actinomycetospora straminea]|nr:DUF5709 domain-containing protein [Actinomycetospora straminea]MDD7933619.1 DUF5709 domain-containing protein [Actinomycetospora straminea]
MTEPEHSDEVPEEPDLGASVQLESGETLDGRPGTDGLDAGVVAPNRPFGLDDPDTTPEGQRERETIDDRLTREIPDDTGGAATAPGPELSEGGIASEAGQGRSGRLTAAEPDPDQVPGRSLAAEDVGIAGGAASAEEAAVHDIGEDDLADLDDTGQAIGRDPDEQLEGPEVRLDDEDVDPASGVPENRL